VPYEMACLPPGDALPPSELPMLLSAWAYNGAACLRVMNRSGSLSPNSSDVRAHQLRVSMPLSWEVLGLSEGDLQSGARGLVLWDLSGLQEGSEAIMIIGKASPHCQPGWKTEEGTAAVLDVVEMELRCSCDNPDPNAPRIQFCRAFFDSRKQCSKFVIPVGRLEVVLRQSIPITHDDQSAKAQVIRGAQALGVQQVLSRLVDGEETGCHRALLSLLAQQKRFRPQEGMLGCFSIAIWEKLLEWTQSRAAKRLGSVAEELRYAETQLRGPEQSVRWCFDTEWCSPFEQCGVPVGATYQPLPHGLPPAMAVQRQYEWEAGPGSVAARLLGEGRAKHWASGEDVSVQISIGATVATVFFSRKHHLGVPTVTIQGTRCSLICMEFKRGTTTWSIDYIDAIHAAYINGEISSPNQRLWYGCSAGDMGAAQAALAAGAMLSCKNPGAYERGPLHALVQHLAQNSRPGGRS